MGEILVSIRNLHHTYLPGTPLAAPALRGAELDVAAGQIAALIGPSGAGKSTLVHFLNGLLRPTEAGRVRVFDHDTAEPELDSATLRRRVGIVFQSPQQQLFERYVADDVAYGPNQLGLAHEEVLERVRWALSVVGLDYEQFADRLTFSLSGGEMRRAALAGVLALRPELLVLDEATTGLDPRGRAETHALLRRLRDDQGVTVLIVSNDMDEVAELAEQVTVLVEGKTLLAGATRHVFGAEDALRQAGLELPSAAGILAALRRQGLALATGPLTVPEAEEALWQAMTR